MKYQVLSFIHWMTKIHQSLRDTGIHAQESNFGNGKLSIFVPPLPFSQGVKSLGPDESETRSCPEQVYICKLENLQREIR